jgi:hypothetical protein
VAVAVAVAGVRGGDGGGAGRDGGGRCRGEHAAEPAGSRHAEVFDGGAAGPPR